MFSNNELMQFNYESYSQGKVSVYHDLLQQATAATGGREGMARREFECQFPFFWLVKESIELKWETAKSTPGMMVYFSLTYRVVGYFHSV